MTRLCVRTLLLLFLLSGCSSSWQPTVYSPPTPSRAHPSFTKDKVLQLKVGLTTHEVIRMFGQPDGTKLTTYGQDTEDGAWSGLKYSYRMGGYKVNYLVFNLGFDPPHLNHWDIEVMY